MNMFLRLAGAAAAVPLFLCAQTLVPSQDAYVVPGNGTNFGSAVNITVGSSASQGLFQFDLSSLPAGLPASQIQKATFTIYANKVNVPGTVNIYEANGAWTESGVNGTNAPAPGASLASSVPVALNQFLTVDATAAVRDWLNNPGNNAGILVVANGGASAQFDAKEATSTGHEALLSIVLNGIPGAQGEAGAQGPAGAVGAQGPAGAVGAQGPAGAPGAQGPAGVPGVPGATGASGTNGTNGNTVLSGAIAPGAGIGNNGDFYLLTTSNCLYGPKAGGAWPGPCTSLIGPQGAAGAAGPAGSQGPAGAAGAQGPAGVPGTPGATGASGTNGTDGNTVLNGAIAPGAGIGNNGDFYLLTTTSCLYGPKAAGAWPGPCTNLVGPTGAAGPAGAAGSQGAQGPAGPQGPVGPQGPAGSGGGGGSVDFLEASRSAADPCPNSVGRPCINPYSLFMDTVDRAASSGCMSFDLTNQLIRLTCPGTTYMLTLTVTAVVPAGHVLGYTMYINSAPGSTGVEGIDSTFRGRIDGSSPGNDRTAMMVIKPAVAATVSIGWEFPVAGGNVSSTSTRLMVMQFN